MILNRKKMNKIEKKKQSEQTAKWKMKKNWCARYIRGHA